MNQLYFSIGGLVWAIAIFKRELLIRKESFRIVLGISVALFLAGLIIHFTAAGQYHGSGALLSPLLSLCLFRVCHNIFLKQFNREPRDTAFIWESGMGADRVFNIMYLILAGGIWIFLAVTFS